MTQITVRLDEELAKQIKAHAVAAGRSVNNWVVAVLGAAVNPDLEDAGLERTRARLARAGLLHVPKGTPVKPPSPKRLARARRAAGAGRPLSEYVSDGRD
jgi:plasmid stability protein